MTRSLVVLWAFLVVQKVAVGLAITSGIKVMPPPGTAITWKTLYAFGYDWLHQFFNITNTRLSPAPIITPPSTEVEPVAPPKP